MLKNYLNGLIINDRTVENGRSLLRSSPTSLLRHGQIEQFAHIQLCFGYLQMEMLVFGTGHASDVLGEPYTNTYIYCYTAFVFISMVYR